MSWETESTRFGREPFQFIAITVERCALTYGTAPCTAALGVTGTRKCFNGWANCQDRANFASEPFTVRICEPVANIPLDEGFLPLLESVEFSPGSIDMRGAMPKRSELRVTCADAPHHDRGFDKYVDERPYDPMANGTFWGKFRARWPYYTGRETTWYSGFLTEPFDLANFKARRFMIERMDGPSPRLSITAKDPLKALDDDRAQYPRPSDGLLTTAIDESGTPATIEMHSAEHAKYPTAGIVCIGREVFQYTGKSVTGEAVTLSGITRVAPGAYQTERQSHAEGDSVQLCAWWNDARTIDILQTLLLAAGLDAAMIPFATGLDWSWEDEFGTWVPGQRLTRLVTSPEGIRSQVDEIQEEAFNRIWWDDEAQVVRYRPVRPIDPLEAPPLLTDEGALLDDVDSQDEPDAQYNEVQVFYGQRDPTQKKDDLANYRAILAAPDPAAQGNLADGRRRVLRVFSRWNPVANAGHVNQMALRTLASSVQMPKLISLKLDLGMGGLRAGDMLDLSTHRIQSETGERLDMRVQAVRVRERRGHIEAHCRPDFFLGRYLRIAPDRLTGVDYFTAGEHDQARYGALCDDLGQLSDGSEGFRII